MSQNRPFQSIFSQPRVQKQLVTIFLIVLILPAALCLFLLFQSGHALQSHYQEQTQADNLRVKSILFDVTMSLYNTAEDLSRDTALLTLLGSDHKTSSDARNAVDGYSGIYDILRTDTSISSITVYHFNEAMESYSYFQSATKEIQQTSWFTRAASSASVFWQSQSRTDQRGNTYWELTLYRRIPLISTGKYAVLAIAVSDNYLKNRLDTTAYETILTVGQDPIFYSSRRNDPGSALPLAVDYSAAYYEASGKLELDGKKTIATVSTLVPLNSEDRLYLVTYDPDALDEIHSLLLCYLLIICATILLPCVLFFVYSRYFSGRVLMLREAMRQAVRENYDIMDSFTGQDELSETFHDLRAMIEKIKAKEALTYQLQLREKELENRQQQMEFKMLASQINPHFLYNTLETIRMKAFTAGAREVASAIKLLGKSLRYVLENTGTVSVALSRELDYIHTYIAIQKLRFGDRINYQEEISPGLDPDDYKILPLLLQPVIENSITHGLKDMEEGGLILLQIFEAGGQLNIHISDNGNGMTRDQLQALRLAVGTEDADRTRSIGLYNINHRLRLCYGKDCQLQMESRPGHTLTTLRFPLKKIKEEHK